MALLEEDLDYAEIEMRNDLPNLEVDSGFLIEGKFGFLARNVAAYMEGINAIKAASLDLRQHPPSIDQLMGSVNERSEAHEQTRLLFHKMNELHTESMDAETPEEGDMMCEFTRDKIYKIAPILRGDKQPLVLPVSSEQDLVLIWSKLIGIVQHDLGNILTTLKHIGVVRDIVNGVLPRIHLPDEVDSLEQAHQDMLLTYESLGEYMNEAVPTILGLEHVHKPITPVYAVSVFEKYYYSFLRKAGINVTITRPDETFRGQMIDYPGFLLSPLARNLASDLVKVYDGEEGNVTVNFMHPGENTFPLPPKRDFPFYHHKEKVYSHIVTQDDASGYPLRIVEEGFQYGLSGFRDEGKEGQGIGLWGHQTLLDGYFAGIVPQNSPKGARTTLVLPFAA